jgi:hypothetical protein
LKGTKLIQVLEPHFNQSKITQVVGRGARYGSHAHLPENERKVHVEHYQSVLPKPLLGSAPTSIERYLHENSATKNDLFKQLQGLMR